MTKRGSYLLGIAGAILGALLAMIPYMLVFYLGYIVFWLGFLFIALTAKGYELTRGKLGYFKIPIVLFFSGCALFLAVVGFDIWHLVQLIHASPEAGYSMIPEILWYEFLNNPEYRAALIKDLFLSAITYVIGIFYFVIQTIREIRVANQREAAVAENGYYGNIENEYYGKSPSISPENYANMPLNAEQDSAQEKIVHSDEETYQREAENYQRPEE